ncbi:hypothetical protein HKD37_18G050644 [Glycine soja]
MSLRLPGYGKLNPLLDLPCSVKNTIFTLSSSPNATQTLTPPSPPPTTTGGRHEPPLLTTEPPHQEENFNRSRILLKDLVEKTPSILPFCNFSEFLMRRNICTWGYVTRFGTPLRLRLIIVGGVACARLGDLDTYCLVFPRDNVVWTRLGYLLGGGITLHLRVEIKCMHHTEHD